MNGRTGRLGRMYRGSPVRRRISFGLTAVGLTAVEIQLTHEVAAGMHAAVITAVKPV